MADLFRQFFWIIFPVFGMCMGAFAIWNEFSRQKKALEVLKIYAEKGTEPPESVRAIERRTARSADVQDPHAVTRAASLSTPHQPVPRGPRQEPAHASQCCCRECPDEQPGNQPASCQR